MSLVSFSPGLLDRRVTIRQLTLTRGAMGGTVEAWTDIATVWGQRLDTTGREIAAAQQITPEQTAMFRIRWRAGMDKTMRLYCESQLYNILSIAEIGRRQWLDIMAVTNTDAAPLDFNVDNGSP